MKMDFHIGWSPEALEDLETIASYLERSSLNNSKAVVSRIFEKSAQLKQFPHSGRIVLEFSDRCIREVFVDSY